MENGLKTPEQKSVLLTVLETQILASDRQYANTPNPKPSTDPRAHAAAFLRCCVQPLRLRLLAEGPGFKDSGQGAVVVGSPFLV